jgi:two-component system nitrogen regulation response regulator NtrX
MPARDGFELLEELRRQGTSVPVLVYTATGDYDRCVRAVKLGAWSFLDKAEPMERVQREIENAVERFALRRQVDELRERLEEDSSLVGDSPAMRALRESIATLAAIPSPVLILGESGTGKELVARDLHRLGPRAGKPMIAVNAAALPEQLVESELFGHERGAFTGADRTRRGAFENANGGTLFLDEIGELPMPAQAKLLRVLEDGKVTRVGAASPTAVDARVVAATNIDLDQAVTEKTFREDLLYRLNVHVIRVPPLRDRLSDVPALTRHLLGVVARRYGQRAKGIADEAIDALKCHDWKRNNVRELRNVVERMIIATPGETIGMDAMPGDLGGAAAGAGRSGGAGGARGTRGGEPDPLSTVGELKDLKADAERVIVRRALERNDWHVTRTAAELGLADHASLSKIMKRHGIVRPR